MALQIVFKRDPHAFEVLAPLLGRQAHLRLDQQRPGAPPATTSTCPASHEAMIALMTLAPRPVRPFIQTLTWMLSYSPAQRRLPRRPSRSPHVAKPATLTQRLRQAKRASGLPRMTHHHHGLPQFHSGNYGDQARPTDGSLPYPGLKARAQKGSLVGRSRYVKPRSQELHGRRVSSPKGR
jgi:hypothetical protein